MSIRTGRPERMDRTSLCLKYSWPLKDMGVFAESVAAAMTEKCLMASIRLATRQSESRSCSVSAAASEQGWCHIHLQEHNRRSPSYKLSSLPFTSVKCPPLLLEIKSSSLARTDSWPSTSSKLFSTMVTPSEEPSVLRPRGCIYTKSSPPMAIDSKPS